MNARTWCVPRGVAALARRFGRAAAAFLRGFLGVMPAHGADRTGACRHAVSPAAARAALAERAARRPNCC